MTTILSLSEDMFIDEVVRRLDVPSTASLSMTSKHFKEFNLSKIDYRSVLEDSVVIDVVTRLQGEKGRSRAATFLLCTQGYKYWALFRFFVENLGLLSKLSQKD